MDSLSLPLNVLINFWLAMIVVQRCHILSIIILCCIVANAARHELSIFVGFPGFLPGSLNAGLGVNWPPLVL